MQVDILRVKSHNFEDLGQLKTLLCFLLRPARLLRSALSSLQGLDSTSTFRKTSFAAFKKLSSQRQNYHESSPIFARLVPSLRLRRLYIPQFGFLP